MHMPGSAPGGAHVYACSTARTSHTRCFGGAASCQATNQLVPCNPPCPIRSGPLPDEADMFPRAQRLLMGTNNFSGGLL